MKVIRLRNETEPFMHFRRTCSLRQHRKKLRVASISFAISVLPISILIAIWPNVAAARRDDCATIILPAGAGAGQPASITSFNPLFQYNLYNQESSALLYPYLLWTDSPGEIDWSRSLLSSVSTTDNRHFLITLRARHWSDGTAVTADDVAYELALIKEMGPNSPNYGLGGIPNIIRSVNVISPLRLAITTTHVVNPTWFTYNGIASLQALPQHAWKRFTLDDMSYLKSTPSFFEVVDGPLKLQRLDVGQDVEFVPNSSWDGPKMHFSLLVLRFQPNILFEDGNRALLQEVEGGRMDAGWVSEKFYQSVQHLPGFHLEVSAPDLAQNVILPNYRNPDVTFFRDVRIRQAIIESIDQNTIVNEVEHHAGDPAYGPVPSSLTALLTPQMRRGIYPVGYNPERAMSLLETAGFSLGSDGIMKKNGRRLSFTLLESLPAGSTAESVNKALQADLRKSGIEMKIRHVGIGEFLALLHGPTSGWDAAEIGIWQNAYPTGEDEFLTGSFENFGGYSDPIMDELIEASISKPSRATLYDYETYASGQQPMIFIPSERAIFLVNNRLHGISNLINVEGMDAPDRLSCFAPD